MMLSSKDVLDTNTIKKPFIDCIISD